MWKGFGAEALVKEALSKDYRKPAFSCKKP